MPETALDWYFRAMEKDPIDKAPHANSIDCFDALHKSDEEIYAWASKYKDIDMFNFNYYMGLAYHDKEKYNFAIKWFNSALQIPDNSHYKVYNSMGISYNDMQKYDEAR